MNRFLKTRSSAEPDELDSPETRRRLRQIKRAARKQRRRRFSVSLVTFSVLGLLLLVTAVWTSLLPRQATIKQDTTPGHGGVETADASAAAMFCGTPQAVFAHFGLTDATGKLMNGAAMPTQAQLSQLPKPDPQYNPNSPFTPQPITYDPAKNQLCANAYTPLYVRFIKPQPAVQGSTNYNPNQPFTSNNPTGLNGIDLNPADWAQQALNGIWTNFWHGLVNFVQTQVVDWASSFGVMYITPAADSYKHPVVTNGMNWSLGIMNGLLACVLVVGGYNALLGYRAGQPVGETMQFIMKFLITGVVANIGFMAFLPQIIELNNSMCGGITFALGRAANGDFTLPLGALNWIDQPATWAVFIVIDFVFALLLIIVMLVRLALLDFLIIIGPLAIMCYAVPQLESVARFWGQAFFCTLFVQFFQVGTLALGSAFIAGFGHASSTPVTIFLGIAALYLAFKWPSMLFSQTLRYSVGVVGRDITEVVKAVASYAALSGA